MSNTQPDQDPRIDHLIREIRGGSGGDREREANKACLDEIHITKVSGVLIGLAEAIFDAQQKIGERITELNGQIDDTRKGLVESSKAASEHSRALVRWTKTSVWTTVAYVVLTAGLLYVAYNQTQIAQLSLQVQAEPQVSLEIEGLLGNPQLSVSNNGAYPVVDISIYYDVVLFWGPPWHQDARGITRLPGSRSPGWWHIEKLGPGEVQTHSMEDPAREALDHTKQTERNWSRGALPDIPSSAKISFVPQLLHHMKFYREADRRAFQKELAVFVVLDDAGKPFILPPSQLPYFTIPSSDKGQSEVAQPVAPEKSRKRKEP